MSRLLKWLSALKLLLLIYGLVVIIGWWETMAVQRGEPRTNDPVLDYPDLTASYAGVSRELYPNRMSSKFWNGYVAFQHGNFPEAKRLFEAALAEEPKDRELLYSYAVTMAVLDDDSPETAAAIAAWEWNYPHARLQDPREVARATHVNPALAAGMAALQANEFELAWRKLGEALQIGIDNNSVSEELVYHYTLAMILAGAPEEHVELAIGHWREKFPGSSLPDPREAARNWQ